MPNPDSHTAAATGDPATCTITALSKTAGEANTRVITVTDAEGNSVNFSIDNGTATSTATVIGFSNANSNATQFATNIAAAINAADTADTLNAAATADGAVVTLSMHTHGTQGNDTTTTAGTAVTDSVVTVAAWSGGGARPPITGSLAAVWYVQDGAVVLTGTARDGQNSEGCGVLIKGDGGAKFTAKVVSAAAALPYATKLSTATVNKTATFNFNRDSDLFIRKVFNTDPTKTNSEIIPTSETTQSYWLGETFESNVVSAENSKLAVTGTIVGDTNDMLGVILGLEGSAGLTWGSRLGMKARAAQTGWFLSQDNRGTTTANFNPATNTDKLFKFHALDSGESANRDLKISIKSIKAPSDNFNKYGTFTVEIRGHRDTDSKPTVVEQFSSVNLNPKSGNYIGRVIGDMYVEYDEATKTIRSHGDNPNNSKYVRVEVSPTVADAGAQGLLPFGVYGPLVPATHAISSGSTATILAVGSGSSDCVPWLTLEEDHGPNQLLSTRVRLTSSIEFPTSRLRVSSSEGGLVLGTKAYFGYQSNIKDTKRFDHTNVDLFRGQPYELDPTSSPGAATQYSWVFTLDDVRTSASDSNHAVYLSGSRAGGTSLSAGGTYQTVLDAGYNQFTSPMFGGFDGYDVTEQDPLRSSYLTDGTEKSNSSFYSVKKALDVVSDRDFVEFDLITMPGITNSSLNTSMINLCEDRADALAIVDIAGGYVPPSGRKTSETDAASLGSVSSTVSNLKTMGVNSSYGCAFYPWVKIRDNVNDALLYVPPSVVALGTLSSSQRKSAVWFAPAGFTRGGLSEGSSGLSVIGVRQRLTSADRDKLYDANVNPIASFPAEGIVIFGQKTLQVTPSALDRINVRRLLIHVKKEISRISSTLLFEQNVQATWNRFLGEVRPFLQNIKSGLGLTDFKVVLDETTTTPDLVDRNVLYAKIFLKPARAIEFIALDFIIMRSGASFDD